MKLQWKFIYRTPLNVIRDSACYVIGVLKEYCTNESIDYLLHRQLRTVCVKFMIPYEGRWFTFWLQMIYSKGSGDIYSSSNTKRNFTGSIYQSVTGNKFKLFSIWRNCMQILLLCFIFERVFWRFQFIYSYFYHHYNILAWILAS